MGTRKGLFRASSDLRRREWRLEGPYLAGYEIYHACLDPRDGVTGYAAAHHAVWGVHVQRSNDGGRSWDLLPEAPHVASAAGASGLEAIWYLAPGHAEQPDVVYAGIQPAGLFVSGDGGGTWEPVSQSLCRFGRKRFLPAQAPARPMSRTL